MTKKGIIVNHISKVYNNRPVVRDVSLILQPSEIVGLLGPNGAGKTTCFSIISGLVKPNSGNILIDQTEIIHLPMYLRSRYGISYLPQESSIFRGLNVYENLLAVLEIIESDHDIIQQKAEELMIQFGIYHLKYTQAVALSGGERRRLEIARMLAINPKYVLLDEPFAGVDPVAIYDIKKIILDLKNRGIGILITDHNVKDMLSIVDRAYIIYDGRVLINGSVEEVISNQQVREVYLGTSFKL